MKTLKCLKITSILQCIFCAICIACISCFAISRWFDSRLFFDIGNILAAGWIFNPIGIISLVLCLCMFLIEVWNPAERQRIGAKWIWIFVWPVITTVMYVLSGGSLVFFTGGV